MRPVLVVTGTKREGAVLQGSGATVLAGGGAPDRLAAELARRVPNAAGVISFGMAGALDPELRLGDWLIGDQLVGDFACACDPAWTAALARLLPGARLGTAFCDGRLIAEPAEKRGLARTSGARTADMESHIAARAAVKAGLPFAVLRCVSDEAGAALPPAVAAAMRPDGGLAVGAMLASLLAQPRQFSDLIATGRRFARAYAAFRNGARAAGPRLGFDLR